MREGETRRPPVEAPAALRRFLGFRKLSHAALETIAATLDADDELRHRVRDASDESTVGHAGWLWLDRPEGWREAIAGQAEADARQRGVHPDERAMRRRLEGAERAVARYAEHVERLEHDLRRAQDDAAALRDERDGLLARCAELDDAVRELRAQRNAAITSLKRTEHLLSRRTDEKRELAERLASLATPAAAAAEERAGEGERGVATARAERVDLAPLLDELGEATVAVAAGLRALRAVLDTPADDERRRIGGPSAGEPCGARRGERGDPREEARGRLLAPPRPRGRVPLPITPGYTSDSAEAAAHLLGTPRAVLLVDGYNVSMAAWPDVAIADQRRRLERLLTELAARFRGLAVELVFDGADVGAPAGPPPPRVRGVSVRFTAPGVEADDEVIAMVDEYPSDRPVLVASTDRRVRDGARRKGANVLSAAQLLAVARPSP